MTAAPVQQISLFDAPAPSKTQVCVKCGKKRSVKLFAWKDRAHTEREDVCNTCRFPRDTRGPDARKQTANAEAVAKVRSAALLNKPHPSGFIPTPPALWAKPGDTVKFLVNDDRTGLTLCIVGTVTGVKPTNKLMSGYLRLRNFLVGKGWQLAEIRGSVVAPLLAQTARTGRTNGE